MIVQYFLMIELTGSGNNLVDIHLMPVVVYQGNKYQEKQFPKKWKESKEN